MHGPGRPGCRSATDVTRVLQTVENKQNSQSGGLEYLKILNERWKPVHYVQDFDQRKLNHLFIRRYQTTHGKK